MQLWVVNGGNYNSGRTIPSTHTKIICPRDGHGHPRILFLGCPLERKKITKRLRDTGHVRNLATDVKASSSHHTRSVYFAIHNMTSSCRCCTCTRSPGLLLQSAPSLPESARCSHNHKWRGSWLAANHFWASLALWCCIDQRARLLNISIFGLQQDTPLTAVPARAILQINWETFPVFETFENIVDILRGLLSLETRLVRFFIRASLQYKSWAGETRLVWHFQGCRLWRKQQRFLVVCEENEWYIRFFWSSKNFFKSKNLLRNSKYLVRDGGLRFCRFNRDIFQR